MRRVNYKVIISLILLTSLGTFFRIYHLGSQSIWLDESCAFFRANNNLLKLWTNQINESSPPLYDIILHYWLKFFNKGEFQLRLLSAIFGILLVPLSFIVSNYIFNQRVALFSTLLVAISPYHIYYSQDAKMYTLLSFLSLGSFFVFYLALNKARIIYWCIYIIITVLLLYCHNYGFLLVVTQAAIFIFLYKIYHKNLFKFLLSQLIIIFLSIPRIICLSQQISMNMNPWINYPRAIDIIKTFTHFSLLSWRLPKHFLVVMAMIIGLPIFIFVFSSAILIKVECREKKSFYFDCYEKYVFFFASLIIPLIIALLISLKKPIYVAGRYDMLVFPFFCQVIALGLDRINSDTLRKILLFGIVISTVFCLYVYYFIYWKSNDRLIAEYIKTYANRDDVLIFTNLTINPFRYYCSGKEFTNVFAFPEGTSGYLQRSALKAEPGYVKFNIQKLKNKAFSLLNDKNKLWLIKSYSLQINSLLINELRHHFQLNERIKFNPGNNGNQITEIYIFSRHTKEVNSSSR